MKLNQKVKKYAIGSTQHIQAFAKNLNLNIKLPENVKIPDIDYDYLIYCNNLWRNVLVNIYENEKGNFICDKLLEVNIEKKRNKFHLFCIDKKEEENKLEQNKEKEIVSAKENRNLFILKNKDNVNSWNDFKSQSIDNDYTIKAEFESFTYENIKTIINEFLFLGYEGEILYRDKNKQNKKERVYFRVFRTFVRLDHYLTKKTVPKKYKNFKQYSRALWKKLSKDKKELYKKYETRIQLLIDKAKMMKDKSPIELYYEDMKNKNYEDNEIVQWPFLDNNVKFDYIKKKFEEIKSKEILYNVLNLFLCKSPDKCTNEFKLFEIDIKYLYPEFCDISSVIISSIYDKAPQELKASYVNLFKIKKLSEYYGTKQIKIINKTKFNYENPRELAVNIK